MEICGDGPSTKEDFYKIIGCGLSSTKEQILTEYKIKALEMHPDKNCGDEKSLEKFTQLQEAKEVLTDDEKRKEYDQWILNEIPIPFHRWYEFRSRNKCSMHWYTEGNKKDPMILDNKKPVQSSSTIQTNDSFSQQLKKFRKYQI